MHPSRRCRKPAIVVSILFLGPLAAGGQIVRDSGTATSGVRGTNTGITVESVMRAQSEFESFRFDNLPAEGGSGSCLELPRNDCYWSDADPPRLPVEPAVIRDRREQLLALLDTLAVNTPGDRWAVEQRVRYLDEVGAV